MKRKNLSLTHALGIFLGLIAYFFVVKLIGFEHLTSLRFFNFFIVLAGMYLLVKKNMEQGRTDYFENLFQAFYTSALAIIMVLFSFYIYVDFLNPGFKDVVANDMIWGRNLSLMRVIFAIAAEGLSSSFILAFIMMQYMKNYATRLKLNVSNP